MKIWKKIKALVLLAVFTLTMLHNAFPHVHHSDGVHELASEFTGHHHSHAHPHSHEDNHHHSESNQSDEQNESSLFSILLKNHAHSLHSHEFILFTTGNSQLSKVEPLPAAGIFNTHRLAFHFEDHGLHRYYLFKGACYDNPILSNYSLRGPPVLG